jgi:hypothetical protein
MAEKHGGFRSYLGLELISACVFEVVAAVGLEPTT